MPDSIAKSASRRNTPALRLAALLLALGGLAAPNSPAARAAEPRVAVGGAVPAAVLLKKAQALGRQPLNTPVSLALTLPLRNQSTLQTLLGRLYDRKDPLYGKYLTADQFTRQFAPTQADYEAVVQYAQAQGLSVERHAGRSLVVASGSSATVEKTFGVRLNQYRLATGRVAYANDVAPTMPASIASRIGAVIGLDSLLTIRQKSRFIPTFALEAVRPMAAAAYPYKAGIGTDPSGGLTPADIKNIYNLNNASGMTYTGEGQSVALVEAGGNFHLSDIGAYVSHFGLPTDGGAIQTQYVNGASASTPVDISGESETVLDIDMVLAVAPRIKFVLPYVSPTADPTNILDVETRIADDNQAQVVSTSLGLPETGFTIPDSFRDYQSLFVSQEQVYERMAAQGQSMFDASGDAGAYDDGVNLSLDYTVSCPTVTDVGGTTLAVNNAGTATAPVLTYGTETSWNNTANKTQFPKGVGSGGGISSFWQKPSYQYLDSVRKTGPIGVGGLLTPAMRDSPDVALNADYDRTPYAIYVADDVPTGTVNNFETNGGTSAAAPLWAAFMALVNEGRALGGAAETVGVDPGTPAHPVGFANPLIYAIGFGQYGNYANDFHDIATGTNLYYPATTGYDDATGWGSFNGANLLRDMVAAAPGGPSGGTSGGSTGGTSSATFPAAGLQMISLPFDFSSTGLDFAGLFGLTTPLASTDPHLILWQSSLNQYVYSPTPPADRPRPGVGYWVNVPAAGLTLQATGAAVTAPSVVALQAGWNQIGDPFTYAEPLTNVTVSTMATGTGPSVPQAASLVSPILYTYPANNGRYVTETTTLAPYAGYWIYARQACYLTFN